MKGLKQVMILGFYVKWVGVVYKFVWPRKFMKILSCRLRREKMKS